MLHRRAYRGERCPWEWMMLQLNPALEPQCKMGPAPNYDHCMLTADQLQRKSDKGQTSPCLRKAANTFPTYELLLRSLWVFKRTWTQGKWRREAKAMVMAGLTWAPEMWPVAKMTIMMANPAVAALPSRVTDPFVFSFTIGVAVAANISTNVPISSVANWFLVPPTSG